MNSSEKFFLDPCPVSELPQELRISGERPVLYLLRRDLEHLYLKESKFGPDEEDQHKAPYLAAMGILTGFDLMAKFYNNAGESGEIFKRFIVEVCGLPIEEAGFVWKFRNALHHSYSLDLRLSENVVFTTEVNGNSWHTVNNAVHYVNLWGLKRFFITEINRFKAKLAADQALRIRFEERYRQSGCIFVLKQEKHPA
ncbi:MAG: hypothetical protein Q7R35_10915 [Elusimicrobiota bacterium]|nr:hypothetical protein [Elusimicrobiota bacterium]